MFPPPAPFFSTWGNPMVPPRAPLLLRTATPCAVGLPGGKAALRPCTACLAIDVPIAFESWHSRVTGSAVRSRGARPRGHVRARRPRATAGRGRGPPAHRPAALVRDRRARRPSLSGGKASCAERGALRPLRLAGPCDHREPRAGRVAQGGDGVRSCDRIDRARCLGSRAGGPARRACVHRRARARRRDPPRRRCDRRRRRRIPRRALPHAVPCRIRRRGRPRGDRGDRRPPPRRSGRLPAR